MNDGNREDTTPGGAPDDAEGHADAEEPRKENENIEPGARSDTEAVTDGKGSDGTSNTVSESGIVAHQGTATASSTSDGGPDTPTAASDTSGNEPDTSASEGDGGRRGRSLAAMRAVRWTLTALAAALLFSALLLPNQLTTLTPSAFAHIPAEGIVGAAVLLVLPRKARWPVAALAGTGLGLLVVLKALDMGFYSVLGRPFDPVLDWVLLDDAKSFLNDSIGEAGAAGVVVGVVLAALAVLVLSALAAVRIGTTVARHRTTVIRTVSVLTVVWVVCSVLGLQVAGAPVVSLGAVEFMTDRVQMVSEGLKDKEEFAKEAAVDDFRDTPADQLLTGLRGKDVLFVFIESYGRSAIEDPAMAPQVGKVLAEGTSRLRAAGFASRSGWLTSPTAGGGSWLAHSTFMSGLWIKNQQRYRTLTSSDRLTLTRAFGRTKAWRTVGIVPGVTRAWPESKFYGLENVYDSRELGYKGPKFSWSRVPDQFSLSAFERLEHGKPGREPLMAEIILTSSHTPWAPLPRMVGWDELGDGSIYRPIHSAGKDPKEVWKDPAQLRNEYRRSIEYSLNSLISYIEKYGNDDTVLVFLGDHQPSPNVTGAKASRDVPVSIVARDKAVLDRISGWGWQEGIKPGPDAPVWRMDTFRDRFLTAYGPQPGAAAPSSPTR